jgi:hypothetical protein
MVAKSALKVNRVAEAFFGLLYQSNNGHSAIHNKLLAFNNCGTLIAFTTVRFIEYLTKHQEGSQLFVNFAQYF